MIFLFIFLSLTHSHSLTHFPSIGTTMTFDVFEKGKASASVYSVSCKTEAQQWRSQRATAALGGAPKVATPKPQRRRRRRRSSQPPLWLGSRAPGARPSQTSANWRWRWSTRVDLPPRRSNSIAIGASSRIHLLCRLELSRAESRLCFDILPRRLSSSDSDNKQRERRRRRRRRRRRQATVV